MSRTDSNFKRCGLAAFTLLEIIVVIALMGMLAAVLSVGASRLLADRPDTPEQIFWGAVSEARKFALLNQTEVRLKFDTEEQAFVASTVQGEKVFPIKYDGELQLSFLGMRKGESSILVGGRLIETSPLDWVRFFEDGTCTPFRVQLIMPGKSPVVLEVDPWTCAEILHTGDQF
jgi:prepilin-type N-terminal cleavage/methylation domain-containing protein